MRTLYVVTHPEATHHVEGVGGGWHDSQLTPAGVRAAGSIARALRDRITDGMDEILRSPCEQQIIVTHGGSLTCVVASWSEMPIESAGYASFRAPSGSITTLHEDDFFRNRQVVSLGDTRHLDTAQD
ncbi:phosphoglycerate mutase family protein [Streptomyces sp. NPDC090112]|uniref:phosphoglycerate mutase family protein n=1 Tax=Streptomyces sp. NPDC090112 TaxID=3365949 RepID=UPI0037FBC63A